MRTGTLTILVYHGLVRSRLEVDDWCFLGVHEFRRQMRFLKDHVVVLPLSEGVALMRAGRLSGPTVALTFDDGFLNNFTLAFPILRETGLPATIFLATRFVDTDLTIWFCTLLRALRHSTNSVLSWRGRRFDLTTKKGGKEASRAMQSFLRRLPPHDMTFELNEILHQLGQPIDPQLDTDSPFRMLGSSDIREMLASGLIELGAHTHSHVTLGLVDTDEREREIHRSLTVVRRLTGRPCTMFAYPYGTESDYEQETLQCLRNHGVETAVTTTEGPNDETTPSLRLKRYGIGSDNPSEDFLRAMDTVVAGASLGSGPPATVSGLRAGRLTPEWIMVSPDDLRASVERWGFHVETVRQFAESPAIAAEDTAYFAGVKAYRSAGGALWAECTTDEAICARVEAFRRLFKGIQRHGYKMTKPIIVDVRRGGGVVVHDGHHRAAVAVFLRLTISARVRWRHRDTAVPGATVDTLCSHHESGAREPG